MTTSIKCFLVVAVIVGVFQTVTSVCLIGCNFDEAGNLIGCQEGFGFRNYNEIETDCVPCMTNCLSCPNDNECQTCKPNFQFSQDEQSCVCPTQTGFQLSGEDCVCSLCIYDDGECKQCPEEFIPSPDPEDFHENAALTMFVYEVYNDEKNTSVYRISLSEEQIVLLSPLSPDTVSDWVTVTLNGYEAPTDYTYLVGWNEIGAIDITFTFNTDISGTDMNVQFMDYSLLVSENGKNLENGTSTAYFKGYSKALESIPVEGISKTTEKLGEAAATASVGTLAASSIMGSSMSVFAKFFQILEMTAIVKLINFQFDPLFSTFLDFISNLTDLNLFSFFTQKIMDKNLLNSEAGPFRGKLTSDGKAPWMLMDFGYLGTLLIILQLALLVFKLTNLQGKWVERIRIFNVQLLQAFSIDFSGTIMSSIGTFGYKTMDVWQVFSVLIAIWLLVVFTLEFVRQYIITEAIYLKDKKSLTKLEKNLRETYLDGMDKNGVKDCFFIRHYNLFFTLKFVAIILIIYSLQFLQAVQILGSLIISIIWLVKSTVMFCKHKFFKSKLTKYFRLCQEFCFTIVLIFTGLFYLNFLGSLELGKTFKTVIVYSAIVMVCLNVLMEVILLVKGVLEVTCCRKKRLNKVGFEAPEVGTKMEIIDAGPKNQSREGMSQVLEELEQDKEEQDLEAEMKPEEDQPQKLEEKATNRVFVAKSHEPVDDNFLRVNSKKILAQKISQNLGDNDSIKDPRAERPNVPPREDSDFREHPKSQDREINLTLNTPEIGSSQVQRQACSELISQIPKRQKLKNQL